ncbi:hypothetical protein B0T16DRAFT_387465 [Cercophora newfieldiana]|uniref:Ubiquitin-like protease family profile domain-containing protein n=1 Tax=Cercophora newfieldiana TaxID=92897 RepID=A0AA39YHP4_9PEZI|nr:hypothetical protein B0T16DRAFT_387465 [Cercophora newfieldiana]
MPPATTPRQTRNSRGLRSASTGLVDSIEETPTRPSIKRPRAQYRATPYPPRRSRAPSPEVPEAIASTSFAEQSPFEPHRATSSAAHATSDQSFEPSSPFGNAFNFTASPVRYNSGNESASFRRRRAIEGEKFARDLHRAIRNDHFMRQCCCGLPPIYKTLEDAHRGSGHLRFYTVDNNKNNLRVIQVKHDLRWHCRCHQSKELHPAYQEHINKGRKRLATDSEFDLIAQNQGKERRTRSIKRVVALAQSQGNESEDSTEPVGNSSVESEQQPSQQPMWSYISGGLATMGASVLDFVGKFLPTFGSARREPTQTVETVETVQQDPENNELVVKRFKREYTVPHAWAQTGEAPETSSDGPQVKWAEDPRSHIGPETLGSIFKQLEEQLQNLRAEKYVGGLTWPEMKNFIRAAPDIDENLTVILYSMVNQDENNRPTSRQESQDRTNEAAEAYGRDLKDLLTFMHSMYIDPSHFYHCRAERPEPSLPFPIVSVDGRRVAGVAARLLTFMLQLREEIGVTEDFAGVLAKIIADANAVHKQEYPMSWVDFTGFSRRGTTLSPSSVFDEIPLKDFEVQPAHEVKFPEPGPSNPVSLADPTEVKRLRWGPKPILKSASTDRPTPSTTERKRKLSFQNPAVKFGGRPSQIPATVMTPYERYIETKPLLNEAAMAKAEERFQLQYHGVKYNPLLDGLRTGIEKDLQTLKDAEPAKDKGPDYPLHVPTEQDKENRRKLDEKMRKEFDRKKKWNAELRASREHASQTPQTNTPKIFERLAFQDTPPEVRKDFDAHPVGTRRLNLVKKLPFMKPNEKPPLSPADRRRALDHFLLGQPGDQQKDDLPPDPFAEEHDELEIASKTLERLELDKQISTDLREGILRARKEQRERQIREAARKKAEAERKRIEEEKRREEEERRQAIAEVAALHGLRRPFAPLITDISDEWEERVLEAQHQVRADTKICTIPDGTDLCRRDFADRLLPETAWLNDNVIIGSFAYIAEYVNNKAGVDQKVNPRCSAFTSFFYNRLLSHGVTSCGRLARLIGVKKANFFDIETILIPICQNSHWTVAVVRPQQRTISHLDSMLSGHGHQKVKNTIFQWVKATLEERFVAEEWKVIDFDAPRQDNGYDCGVFAITNGICLALGVNPVDAYSADQLTLQRKRLAAILINGGFSGEFSMDDI